MKRFLLSLVACLSVLSIAEARQPLAEYHGRLNPGLLPNRNFHMTIRFDPLPDSVRVSLPDELEPEDTVLLKRLKWPPEVGKPLMVYLVDPHHGEPAIYLDLDQNGSISANERFPFPHFHPDPGPEDDLVIWLPFKFAGTIYDKFPVTFRPSSREGASREVSYSNSAYATGVVNLEGKNVLVQYGIDAESGSVNPKFEGLGVDVNGDGKIDLDENSPEIDYGNHGESIFHVGEHYVSTRSIDSSTGMIILSSRMPSDYKRIDLATGNQIPDFSFVDLDGKAHKLSDYRGSYVLLDFWATWCAPCVGEVPFLKDIYNKFHTRNFEIIGMDMENGWDSASTDEMLQFSKDARSFVSKYHIEWPQARTDAIAHLVNERFRINSYPMKLLLDPEGRILLRQSSRGHDDLVSLLSRLLPQHRN